MVRSLLVAPVLATVMLGSATPALGAGRGQLVVGSDREECPQAQFARIQDAVNAAGPGSTIVVCPGTYREMVTITTNDVRIVSQHGPEDVVVEGTPANPHNAQEAGFLLHMVSGV